MKMSMGTVSNPMMFGLPTPSKLVLLRSKRRWTWRAPFRNVSPFCTTSYNTELEEVDPRSTKSNISRYTHLLRQCTLTYISNTTATRMSEIEWFYSLGYKIQRRPPATAGDPDAIDEELGQGGPQDVHVYNGWQSICWVTLTTQMETMAKIGAALSAKKDSGGGYTMHVASGSPEMQKDYESSDHGEDKDEEMDDD
ncbi:hypothetical protein F4604DRAFT_1956826, partial [Suillus subluteus]